MTFNSDQLRNDVIRKQNDEGLKFYELAIEIGIGGQSLWKIKTGQKIGLDVFIKILTWLKTKPNRYFKI